VSGDFLRADWDIEFTFAPSREPADRGTRKRLRVMLWILPSLIAYSNGVDESWKARIGHGIRWLNPKLSQSAIVPQFIGSVFCSHFGICWLAVCSFDVHRSAFFHRLFIAPSPPLPHSFPVHVSLWGMFLPFSYGIRSARR